MIEKDGLKQRMSVFFNKAKNILNKVKIKEHINKVTEAKLLTRLVSFLKNISWKSPKTIGISALSVIILGAGIFYLSTTVSAVGITVNGKNIGYAQNKTEAEQIVQEVLQKHGEVSGQVAHTNDKIEYEKARIKKDEYAANKISFALLLNAIIPYINACGIQIEGQTVVHLADTKQADLVLTKYKEYFTKPGDKNVVDSAEFEEEVTKVAVKVHPSDIISVDEALDFLLKGDAAETEYTIQKDDSFWLIARKHNMLVDEVLAANPGFTEDTIIQPGQTIKLAKIEPFLTVISKGTKVVKEVIPFDVQTVTSTKVAAGKSVVQQAGKDGEKEVTYKYVEKNGKTLEKTVVKEEVLAKPVKQIIAKGPAVKPVYVGTSRGSGAVYGLQWPLSGRITSYYGYRSRGFHTGIDIDGVTGQPYYAATAGKVVLAGYVGNYGYCIIVDHGNGVATRYAHSSKLLVSVGDQVKKGQNIGLVGSTGKSTGSHLHFEVIVNGSTVNPLNYLP
ncbi:MAG: peptidoglycan DD-metalloendopeptidase family protein [Peptococcaceae bacterium]|jgi:murein DD-endopeptidase MepM/ murein hydrolase activator NlpD|nr:peptidoglycan DD-metalloendopeptidase family protein [Peptococcaceae bacterium]